jgi:hypothetical protein
MAAGPSGDRQATPPVAFSWAKSSGSVSRSLGWVVWMPVWPSSDGGQLVGLDPSQFGEMTDSLSSGAKRANELVMGYLAQMAPCGLDTSRMARAAQDLAWALDQLPMLRRRLELAAAMEQQDATLGMQTVGAGSMAYRSAAAADRAGKAAGEKALAALEHEQGEGDLGFIALDLSENVGDPDYLAAFFGALGPEGTARLGVMISNIQDPGQQSGWSALAGSALAVASYKVPLTPQWLTDASIPPGTGPELDSVAPLLEHGVYSPAWLDVLGEVALQDLQQSARSDLPVPAGLDAVWTALANNPGYAAKFFSAHSSELTVDMTNPVLYSADDAAFAAFVRTATIAPPGANAKPYAVNAESLVHYFGRNPALRTTSSVRQAMALIAMNYSGDLQNSVTAAAPGLGESGKVPGWLVTASETDWQNFVTEAMRDKTAAAQLIVFYGQVISREQQRPDPGPWGNLSIGKMQNFLATSYSAARAPAGSPGSETMSSTVAAAGTAFAVALLAGPEAGVAVALEEALQAGSQTAVSALVTSAFGNDPNSSAPAALENLTSDNVSWENIVRGWYQRNSGKLSVASLGDPEAIIAEYGGAKASFLEDNGILPLWKIQENNYKLAAYNAWLQTPAVANAINTRGQTDSNWQRFLDDMSGKNN